VLRATVSAAARRRQSRAHILFLTIRIVAVDDAVGVVVEAVGATPVLGARATVGLRTGLVGADGNRAAERFAHRREVGVLVEAEVLGACRLLVARTTALATRLGAGRRRGKEQAHAEDPESRLAQGSFSHRHLGCRLPIDGVCIRIWGYGRTFQPE
jgi:hypothetical protein